MFEPGNWMAWSPGDRFLWVVFQFFSIGVMFWITLCARFIFQKIFNLCHLLCDPRGYYLRGPISINRGPTNPFEKLATVIIAISISGYFGYTRLHNIFPWWID